MEDITKSDPEQGHPQQPEDVEEAPEAGTPDFDAIMESAASRMAGEPQRKEPEPATPAPQPEPTPETPAERLLRLKVGGEEKELPESEVLKLANQGADYTRKTMELAQDRDRLKGLEALWNTPGFQDHAKAFLQQQQKQQQPEAPQPPTDPIERIKWEAKQEILREMQPMAERQQALAHQVRLQQTLAQVQQDPAFPHVRQALDAFIAAQPESLRRETYNRLNSDPDAFLATYGEIRGKLAAHVQKMREQQAKDNQTPAAPQPQAQPQQTRTPRQPAPQLEGAGAAPSDGGRNEASLRKLRAQIKQGTAGPDALGKFLELSGAFNRM